jgi:hypothetical protein
VLLVAVIAEAQQPKIPTIGWLALGPNILMCWRGRIG